MRPQLNNGGMQAKVQTERQPRQTYKREVLQTVNQKSLYDNNSNIVYVQCDRKNTQFYVYLVKQMFHTEKFEEVELHGQGQPDIFTVIKLSEILTKYCYASVGKIKTKSFQARNG